MKGVSRLSTRQRRMKFELNEYHRNIRDEELLCDLQRVASLLSRNTVTVEQYTQNGKYNFSTIQKRFGSWKNALQLAYLDSIRDNDRLSNEEYIDDLKRVARILNKKTITSTEYSELGIHGRNRVLHRFGSWQNALLEAGLLPTGFVSSLSDGEILEEIERIWILLGRQPTTTDIKSGISKYSLNSYARHFGSWRGALQAFVEWINSDNRDQQCEEEENSIENESTSSASQDIPASRTVHETKRDINLRLRFKVMQRDSFKCCLCGASPAKDSSVELHIDHIKPWSKGGETTMENLRTLCSKCNLGKSDLYDE